MDSLNYLFAEIDEDIHKVEDIFVHDFSFRSLLRP
jgi:hypothetical protein